MVWPDPEVDGSALLVLLCIWCCGGLPVRLVLLLLLLLSLLLLLFLMLLTLLLLLMLLLLLPRVPSPGSQAQGPKPQTCT